MFPVNDRGLNSSGSASASHAEGHRFNPYTAQSLTNGLTPPIASPSLTLSGAGGVFCSHRILTTSFVTTGRSRGGLD
jgi:hypothetical protein